MATADDQIDDRANEILGAILEEGDGDPNETADSAEVIDSPAETAKSDEQVAEELSAEPDKDDSTPEDEALPAHIEPPTSWKAEAKERFKALTPELQKYVADRESERERGIQQAANEQIQAKKAAEAELASIKAERQAYADRLGAIVDGVANSNPKLAEWQQRDWEKYARENPLEYGAEWFAYQKAAGALQAAHSERQRVQQQMVNEQRLKAHQVLTEKLDFWKDDTKRKTFQSELRDWGKSEGWSDAEISGIEDARALIMARKAMLYDKLTAEQSKIAAMKKPTQTGKVLKVQSTDSTSSGNQQADKLRRVAAKTGRLDDQAAAVLASL